MFWIASFGFLLEKISCLVSQVVHSFCVSGNKGPFAQLHRKGLGALTKNAIQPDTKSKRKISFCKSFLLCRSPTMFAHADFIWWAYICTTDGKKLNAASHERGSLSARLPPSRPTHTFFSSCRLKEHKFLSSESQYSFQESYFVNLEPRRARACKSMQRSHPLWLSRSALIFQKRRGSVRYGRERERKRYMMKSGDIKGNS